MNLPKLPNFRIGCAGPFQETTLLRIERPSIATARHYYNDKNHNNIPLGDGMGSLEVTSSNTPQIPTAPIPRRHSAVVQKSISEQSSPRAIPGSIPAYYSDGIRKASIISEEMIVRGGQKSYDFLCPSSASSPVSAEPYPPSISTTQAVSLSPADSLHLPITTLPLNPTKNPNIRNPLHPQYLGNIPWDYTSHRLQEWGLVYLYNTATADAFVRAVPLNLRLRSNSGLGEQATPPDSRRPSGSESNVVVSTIGVEECNGKSEGQSWDTVHQPDKAVKCVGSSLERTPLGGGRKVEDELGGNTQVQHPGGQEESSVIPPLDPSLPGTSGGFDKNLLCSPPPPPSVPSYMRKVKVRARVIPATTGASTAPRQTIVIEKSFPVNVNRLLDHFRFSEQYPSSCPPSPPPSPPLAAIRHHEVPALPIHTEYATYRVPLLGAILVSGFVKTGDTVEVPLPWPELWEETVVEIYTGGTGARGSSINSKVRRNLEFLGWKEITFV